MSQWRSDASTTDPFRVRSHTTSPRALVAAAVAVPAAGPAGLDGIARLVEDIPSPAEALDPLAVCVPGALTSGVLVEQPPVVRGIRLAVPHLRPEQRGLEPASCRGSRYAVGERQVRPELRTTARIRAGDVLAAAGGQDVDGPAFPVDHG